MNDDELEVINDNDPDSLDETNTTGNEEKEKEGAPAWAKDWMDSVNSEIAKLSRAVKKKQKETAEIPVPPPPQPKETVQQVPQENIQTEKNSMEKPPKKKKGRGLGFWF